VFGETSDCTARINASFGCPYGRLKVVTGTSSKWYEFELPDKVYVWLDATDGCYYAAPDECDSVLVEQKS
jgi:hypothetical protein